MVEKKKLFIKHEIWTILKEDVKLLIFIEPR